MDRRRILQLGAGLMLGAALPACSPAGDKGAVLKVGSQKGGAKALVLASGVLEGAPYRVEWSEFPAAQHLLEAIGAGAVDLGAVGDAPFLFAYAAGAPIKAVQASRSSGGGASTAVLVRGDSPLTSAAQLKGRRVATGRGSIGHFLLLKVLEREGLKRSDVDLVFLAPGDAKAAFATGAVDAWVTWGSYVALAIEHDGARVLSDGRGLLSGYGFEVAGDRAIAGKSAELTDFLRRLAQAKRWVGGHRDEYAKVLAKETGLELSIAAYTVANTRGEPVPIDQAVIGELSEVLAVFRAAGELKAAPEVGAAFAPAFNAALTS
ncbi:MAG: aliphatic sulfonate ABC transporter substrate-binding protein [Phenylobacterium sp.]|uniref:ABC transporter substrate-binding protein n=1 Tax=Phenylobacterium sp. TaxID=1871053 RepID=UPI0025DF406F|nr:ABC transporter substrate-binding protein [Phenylobacterium sp.]MBA4010302.1 aliphatic sulfonate ABC transporter substrate-binding protein [Phenylobacterium sp.]